MVSTKVEKIMTRVRNSKERVGRKTVISDEELEAILTKANKIQNEFYRLRALAVISVLRLTGKRRGEVAMLELANFKVEDDRYLSITFTLEKKRKGKVLNKQSKKLIPLSDSLTKHILKYLSYLRSIPNPPKYFLPRTCQNILFNLFLIDKDHHIKGRQVFNIVRKLTDKVWPHLFRETVASDIIKKDPTLIGIFKVMQRLDLESYETGFHYLRRFAGDIIIREEQKFT